MKPGKQVLRTCKRLLNFSQKWGVKKIFEMVRTPTLKLVGGGGDAILIAYVLN